MTKIIEEVIDGSDAAFANAKYVKIYISPESGKHTIDVMTERGLRIFVPVPVGKPKTSVRERLMKCAQAYRPESYNSHGLEFIADCISDVLVKEGKISNYEFGCNILKSRWLEKVFIVMLRREAPKIEYESALVALKEYYEE
jgi:hypothetical protein